MATATNQSELLPTRQSLLSRLRDWDDHESWREFFDLYWKLLYQMACKRGLTEQEAQEVVQETVIALARTMPEFRYDPSRCSFKSWLRHLLEKKVADQFRKRARPGVAAGLPGEDTTEALDNLPDPSALSPDVIWEEQWRQHLLESAIERIKAKVSARQFQIFHRLIVLNFPPAEVAATLNANRAQVYLAKHRVSALVKKEVRRLEKELG
jgi:RNA polymerase sigma-70 factor (ECF subfamily)